MICRDCGELWRPVRRGECVDCGSDAGPVTEAPNTTPTTHRGEQSAETNEES